MKLQGIVIIMCSGVVIGCGGSSVSATGTASGEVDRGDTQAPASLRVLPSGETDPGRFTPTMQRAWEFSEEAVAIKPPSFPVAPATSELDLWSREVFQPWLEKKQERVVTARRELDRAAEESMRQRILAGAIVGVLYEDVGHVFLAMPTPKEILNEEPEIVQAFKDVIQGQAKPYLSHSKAAYTACERNAATGRGGMAHWSDFCRGRASNLPLLAP